MKSKPTNTVDHPKTSNGKKWAAANRKKANQLSDEQRAALFQKGLARVYGKFPKETVLAGR